MTKPPSRMPPPLPDLEDSVPVEIVSANEPWNDYELADGTKLRVRTILIEVFRSKSKYDPEGNPLYNVKAGQLMNISSPSKLKQKKR